MKKRILIVEDTPDLLESITEFLLMEGYEVIGCLNAKQALEKIDTMRPAMIITDLSMMHMDGFQFIETIRNDSKYNMIPIAIFSARPPQENQAKALSLGIKKYIKKPCQPEELLKAVEEILNESEA